MVLIITTLYVFAASPGDTGSQPEQKYSQETPRNTVLLRPTSAVPPSIYRHIVPGDSAPSTYPIHLLLDNDSLNIETTEAVNFDDRDIPVERSVKLVEHEQKMGLHIILNSAVDSRCSA